MKKSKFALVVILVLAGFVLYAFLSRQRSKEKITDTQRDKILAQILSAEEVEEEVNNPYFSEDSIRDFCTFREDIDEDGKKELIASVNIGGTGVMAVFEKEEHDFVLSDIERFMGKQGIEVEIKDVTADKRKEIIVVNYKHPGTDMFIEEFFVFGYINEKICSLWKGIQRDAMFGSPEDCYESKAQIKFEDLDGNGINEIVSLETYYDYSFEEKKPLLDSKKVTRQVFRFDGEKYVKQYEEVLETPVLKK